MTLFCFDHVHTYIYEKTNKVDHNKMGIKVKKICIFNYSRQKYYCYHPIIHFSNDGSLSKVIAIPALSSSFTFCVFFNDISPKMIYCNVIMIFGFNIPNKKHMNTHIFLLINKKYTC